MKNVKQLRDSLLESFESLKKGELKSKKAKELTSLAGKILMSAKVELNYNQFMDNQKTIEFLEN